MVVLKDQSYEAVGESYGIVGTKPDSLTPALVKPQIDLAAAKHGYLYSVVVSKREESDAWQVYQRGAGGVSWQLAANGTGKSLDVVYSPPTPGDAEQLVAIDSAISFSLAPKPRSRGSRLTGSARERECRP